MTIKQMQPALLDLQNEWTAWKGGLLLVGTFLAGISFIFGLLKAVLA